jgi:DNA processing protein
MDDIHTTSVVMALREPGGVGPKLFQALLATFGSPENVYGATFEQLADMPRLSEERAGKILDSQHAVSMMSDRIERLADENIRIMTFIDEGYPDRLRSLDNPPPVVYYKGSIPQHDARAIAVVGTTRASEEAIEATVDISSLLARENCAVVSGLARGIDSAAHIGALKHEGVTHAVLGSGFYSVYPPENKTLSEQITEKGALICEYPPDTEVSTGRLQSRNRIIVGMSDAVIIGELSSDSTGSFSAAACADRQGKLVFYLLRGDEEERGVTIPANAIPFETLDDFEAIVTSSIGS